MNWVTRFLRRERVCGWCHQPVERSDHWFPYCSKACADEATDAAAW